MIKPIGFVFIVSSLTACSAGVSSEVAGPVADAGDEDGATTVPDGGATERDSATVLEAPRLDTLVKMSGALHVSWTNRQSDCTTVRVERKSDAEDWAERFSVSGRINNKMDGTATRNTTYTYRLRCERAGAFSAYSNELGRNPTI